MSRKILLWAVLTLGAFQGGAALCEEPGGRPASTATTAKMLRSSKAPQGFEPIAGAKETDKIDPNPLVVGAYAMFFVLMFGYLVFVARRQASIAKEMAELGERIRRMEASGAGGDSARRPPRAEKK